MDGTEQTEFGLAEAEFSNGYEKSCKKRGIAIQLRACTEEALFQTILKFEKHLDRVLAQKLKDGRLEMTHQIFPDLFVDAKNRFLWETAKYIGPVLMLDPFVALNPQVLQDILRELSAKAKEGIEGKIILPEGYFYFTWFGDDMCEIDGDAYNHEYVVQAKDFNEAVIEIKKHLYSLTAKDFRVYYGGRWRGIKLVQNGFVLEGWDQRESKNIKFIEKK